MDLHSRPFVIGIGGGSGSGKSTVALTLHEWYAPDVVLLPQDCYYRNHPALSPAERQTLNYDEPAAIDHPLLLAHLKALLNGQPVERPRYDFTSHQRETATERVEPARVILVEGLFALWEESIRALLDLRIFVAADSDLRLIRRLRRDVLERGRSMESVIAQYLGTVRPMHETWVEPTRHHAHVVVENAGSLEGLVELLDQVIVPHLRPRRRAHPVE